MCTPIGHSLAGLTLYYATGSKPAVQDTRRLGWFILLANLPDFDFIPGILTGDPGRYHHGISHSIGMVLIVFMLAWWWGKPRLANSRLAIAFTVFAVVGSHLLLDWLTWDPPGLNGQGIPLLWPWSDTYYLAPHTIFPRVERHNLLSAETLTNNLTGLAIELAVFTPLALLARWWMMRHRASLLQ